MRDQNTKPDSQKRKNYEEKKKKIRSPLLDLGSNGIPNSSAIDGGQNSCFHFLVSSNNPSYSSGSSSLSGSVQQKKPKLSSPSSSGKQRWKSTKENILPVPISLKPQKNASRLLQWRTGENPTPETSKKSQIWKNGRSGYGKAAANLKPMGQVFDLDDNVSSSEKFTPVGKRKTADCGTFENVGEDNKDSNVVKTPPIKSSVSPEIQCNVLSATPASSAVTPCYSAGHVLSGISDKRKCRPIGVLTVPLDYEKANKKSCIIGILDDQKADCLVPLPAEASMLWLSSSCGGDLQKIGSDSQNQIRGPEELPYSSSFCCKVEERNSMKSPLSGSSVSSDNVIQTPSSDSASDRHTTFSCLNVNQSKLHKHESESELDDGLAEVVNGVRLPL